LASGLFFLAMGELPFGIPVEIEGEVLLRTD
jgi:hypothetical protein